MCKLALMQSSLRLRIGVRLKSSAGWRKTDMGKRCMRGGRGLWRDEMTLLVNSDAFLSIFKVIAMHPLSIQYLYQPFIIRLT